MEIVEEREEQQEQVEGLVEDVNRFMVRQTIRSAYDVQHLRIATGNRIAINFRIKLGQSAGTKTEDMDAENQKILKTLTQEYRRLTDGITNLTPSKMRAIIGNNTGKGIISDKAEFLLIGNYLRLQKDEAAMFSELEFLLEGVPIYDQFLKGVKGVGPAMAGVVVANFDPYDYTRCLDRDCGWREPIKDQRQFDYFERFDDVMGRIRQITDKGVVCPKCGGPLNWKKKYVSSFYKFCGLDVVVSTDPETGELTCEGRSRKKAHLVTQYYRDKEGNWQTKLGLPYRPEVKSRLTAVLGSCFLRTKDSVYAQIYHGYRNHLEVDPRHAEKTKMHKHRMAMRYMTKQFLKDLYLKWREIEGLVIYPPYEHRLDAA